MTTTKPTKALPLSAAELELREMWNEAEIEFNRLTRRNLRTDREKKLEDVIDEFERKYQPPPPEPGKRSSTERKQKIQGTILKVLQCVQLLGGLAAQGASIVFGPATLCFNAVSFLLDVPGKILSIYEGIESLFEEVAHFLVLSKLSNNYTSLDPALRDGTHKLMMCVVRICALSIKIIDGGVGHHIKVGMKITFLNDDSDVGAELAKIKDLIEKQNRITSAVTLQHVMENQRDIAELLKADYLHTEQLSSIDAKVDILVADVGDRKTQKITTDRVDTIAKMLLTSRELVQDAQKAFQSLKDGIMPGTSQWLLPRDEYTDWKATNPDVLPILLISGPSGTGKSHLLANIEQDLRNSSSNLPIAYYAFSERDVKGPKDRNRDEISTALKSMALQLANQYPPYAKEMAAMKGFSLPDGGRDSDKQWWNMMLFTKYAQSDENTKITFMFDGVDMLSEAEALRFETLLTEVHKEERDTSQRNTHNLRIVVTGNWQKAARVPATVETLYVVDHNESDIEAYIKQELSKDVTLQGQHVEMQELLKSIRTTLPTQASGSFAVVQQKLERIREAIESNAYLDDVEQILKEDPTTDHDSIARKIIHNLNTTLQAQEIEQLNEILIWLVFGYQYFTVDGLRAALFLKSGRSPLQPFENMLKKKFSKIVFQEGNAVDVYADIQEVFKSNKPAARATVDPDGDGSKISMTVTVSQADLRTVQQFFWDLTERIGISKFDFFEASRTNDGKGFIHCEKFQAHYHITAQLLKLMNDEPNEKTKVLVRYAMMCLPEHLKVVKEALDNGILGAGERKIIAERLVDLLSDVEGIEKHWNIKYETYENWINEEGIGTIQSWLTDSKTVQVLEPRQRRWVRQFAVETQRKADFYKPITIMLARRWLQDYHWDHHDTYVWIDKFSRLQIQDDSKKTAEAVDKREEEVVVTELTDSEDTYTTPDDILSAMQWAQQTLDVQDESLNSLWFERIGEACYDAGKYGAARSWYDKARGLPDSSWTVEVKWAIAEATLSKEVESEADQKTDKGQVHEALDSALSRLRASWETENDSVVKERKDRYISSLKDLASWYEKLHATERAIELYKEALTMDSQDTSTYHELLKLLSREDMHQDVAELLSQILTPQGESNDPDLFLSIVRELAKSEDIEENILMLNCIVALSQVNETLTNRMLEGLRAAIQDAKENNLSINEGLLLLYLGVVQARSATDDASFQQAIKSWEDCQSLYIESAWDLLNTKSYAARYVTQYHFNQSMDQKISNAEREEHINRLMKLSRVAASRGQDAERTSYLASYYAKQGRLEEARKVRHDDMVDALGILTDNDPDNDLYGWKFLADSLMHAGDDLNALSAWSMLTPNVCGTSFGYRCDGRCGKSWDYPSDLYVCRYCPGNQM